MTVKLPKERRWLYKGDPLNVYWLALPGDSLPAKKQYQKKIDPDEALASFRAIDRIMAERGMAPKTLLEKENLGGGVGAWVIKAPQRGTVIGRLICHKGQDWNLFVAYCGKKKTQTMPDSWKKTARDRIRESLANGGP